MEIFENLSLENINGEIWKKIEEYNGDYYVSNLGRVKSFKRYKEGKILSQNKDSGGYSCVGLCKNGEKSKTKRIHILMVETFHNYKLKKNECIHHIDKTKNNFMENFQIMTKGEHTEIHNTGLKHSEETKELMSEQKKGENHPNSTLKEQDVIQIRLLLKEGILTQKEISKKYGVNKSTISYIKTGKSWKHLKEN